MDYDNLGRVVDLQGPGARATCRAAAQARPARCTRRHAPLVFITGASSGIGQALALRFYHAGYGWRWWRGAPPRSQAWARRRASTPARCAVYGADVADIEASSRPASACIAAQGLPDVVIANAGISVGMDTAERGDLDVMRATFATNNVGLAATFHPFVAADVRARQRPLVGIGSVAAIRGLPGHGAYCASKAAVVAYCESLRGEMRAAACKVVTICPGLHRHAADAGQPLLACRS